MDKALGLLEVRGLSCAVEAADAMVKAADVTLVELETARGNGMMTIKVTGNVSAVSASIESGKAVAAMFGALVSADVIARPAKDIGKVFLQDGQKERPVFFREKQLEEVKEESDAGTEETALAAEPPTESAETVQDDGPAETQEFSAPVLEETQTVEAAAEVPELTEQKQTAVAGKAKQKHRQRRARESKKSQAYAEPQPAPSEELIEENT